MLKILYLIPAAISKGPMGAGVLPLRRRLLRERGSSDFDWDVGETSEGPYSIESLDDEEQCIPGTLRAAITAEREGFSAIVLGCFADPGLALLRSMLSIPVVGAASCSLQLACMLGGAYGILTISDDVVPLLRKVVRDAGFENRMAGIRTIGTTVAGVGKDRERMLQRLIHVGELAVAKDRAEVLVLGCMSLAFLNLAKPLQDRLQVPVVCPLATAVNSAEAMLRAKPALGTNLSIEVLSPARSVVH